MNGILLVDKPAGITSHDVVRRIKKITGAKTGHAGTLDPFATGLLVLLLGEATKISNLIINDDKFYEGEAVFGKSTDTFDATGKIIEEKKAASLNEEKLNEAFLKFTGTIEQIPPSYSAIKINGKKAYELARKGKEVVLKKRKVKIHKLDLTDFYENDFPRAFFRVAVSKGTYIRSLVNDIGKRLNTGAYLKNLRRLSSGKFSIKNSCTLSGYEGNHDLIKSKLISISTALDLPEVKIKNSAKKAFINGAQADNRFLASGSLPLNQTVKVIDSDGKILSIQKTNDNKAKVLAVFKYESN